MSLIFYLTGVECLLLFHRGILVIYSTGGWLHSFRWVVSGTARGPQRAGIVPDTTWCLENRPWNAWLYFSVHFCWSTARVEIWVAELPGLNMQTIFSMTGGWIQKLGISKDYSSWLKVFGEGPDLPLNRSNRRFSIEKVLDDMLYTAKLFGIERWLISEMWYQNGMRKMRESGRYPKWCMLDD